MGSDLLYSSMSLKLLPIHVFYFLRASHPCFVHPSPVHRWARLLTQQMWITVFHSPTRENKLPFSVGKRTGS